jgi:hypothetical protein
VQEKCGCHDYLQCGLRLIDPLASHQGIGS